jgi:hypothetical protein
MIKKNKTGNKFAEVLSHYLRTEVVYSLKEINLSEN